MSATLTVGQLAEWVDGDVLGDAGVPITDARPAAQARAGDITVVGGGEPPAAWYTSRASAAVVPAGRNALRGDARPVIRAIDPRAAFDRIVHRLRDRGPAIHPTASVHLTVTLGSGAMVGPFATVGAGTVIGTDTALHAGAVVGRGCRIGAGVTVHAGAVLYDHTVVEDRSVIHSGAVIGADGFGYRTSGGRHAKIPHLGQVEVGADVEVGPGTTVDRGTFGATRVGAGTKVGSLVMIAHNCQVGRDNTLGPQAGIAGSSVTGDGVALAAQSGVSDHIRVGAGAAVGPQAAVMRDVAAGQRVSGILPARPTDAAAPEQVALGQLPRACADVRRIKKFLGLSAE